MSDSRRPAPSSRGQAAGYPRLQATVWEWNGASRRVLEKLGFREPGRDGDNLLAVREL